MHEIINKIDGGEIPQLVIIDESVKDTRLVKEIVRRSKRSGNSKIKEGIIPIHIGHDGFGNGMSDSDIVELGRTLGYPYILTHDRHFYRFKEDYEKNMEGYGRIVVLRQLDSMYNYLKAVKREGIKISGNGISKVRSFG